MTSPDYFEPVEGLRASGHPPPSQARSAPPPRSPNFFVSPQSPERVPEGAGGPGRGRRGRGAAGAGRGPPPARGGAAAPHSSLARAGCGREC